MASRIVHQTTTKVVTNMVKTKAAQLLPAVDALVAGFKAYGCKPVVLNYSVIKKSLDHFTKG